MLGMFYKDRGLRHDARYYYYCYCYYYYYYS